MSHMRMAFLGRNASKASIAICSFFNQSAGVPSATIQPISIVVISSTQKNVWWKMYLPQTCISARVVMIIRMTTHTDKQKV